MFVKYCERTRTDILRKMSCTQCTTSRTVLFWVFMQRVVVISYRLFGKSYRSHLKGTRVKMGPIGCPETSVWNFHYSPRNNLEEGSYHLIRDERPVFTHRTSMFLNLRWFCSVVHMFPITSLNFGTRFSCHGRFHFHYSCYYTQKVRSPSQPTASAYCSCVGTACIKLRGWVNGLTFPPM